MKLIDLLHILNDKNMLNCEIVWDMDKEYSSNWLGYLSETPWYLAEQTIKYVEISKSEDEKNAADLFIELDANDVCYDRCQ